MHRMSKKVLIMFNKNVWEFEFMIIEWRRKRTRKPISLDRRQLSGWWPAWAYLQLCYRLSFPLYKNSVKCLFEWKNIPLLVNLYGQDPHTLFFQWGNWLWIGRRCFDQIWATFYDFGVDLFFKSTTASLFDYPVNAHLGLIFMGYRVNIWYFYLK